MEVASPPIRSQANDAIDHSDLSAIAAFNKAHDESQKANRQAVAVATASPKKPVARVDAVAEQTTKPGPMVITTVPVSPAVPVAASASSHKQPATPSTPVAPSPVAHNAAAGVKRAAADVFVETPGSPAAKKQHISPQLPASAQPRTLEQPIVLHTSSANGHRPQNGDAVGKDPVVDYGSDSDDDYEKHPPDESLLGASGYSFSNSFSNGQLLDPSQHLRIQSLPILDNLSSQLLGTLLQGQFQDTLITVTQPETDQGQAYATLKALFWQTKRLYSSDAFLSTDELRFQVPEHRNMIRQVNLATFITSLFGSSEVGFFHMNQYFLPTFVPEGGRLLKLQGGLFLGLKTQAYISALDTGEKTKEQTLDDLFEDDVAAKLTARRGGMKELIPSEVEFLSRLKNRRDQLEKAPADVSVLREVYPWSDFLREIVQYVAKHRDSMLAPVTRKKLRRLEATQSESSKNMFQTHAQSSSSMYGQHSSLYTPPPGMTQPIYPGYSSVGRPSMHAAYSGHVQTATGSGGPTPTGSVSGAASNTTISAGASQSMTPHPEQSTPTHILYEQARLAATARQSPNARRAGLPSQRRPWSTEEEHALMVGLDYVKGPHWSQILAMFGAGGTVSEALKDRNQVQLKDKARNLKLFFLKSGMEVPYYLQFVTGELKTRAPGQVAKNEKRKQQEEEANQNRATVDALNVLTAGTVGGESGQLTPTPARPRPQPAPQLSRPQPTAVQAHPQRWAMSHNQPQPQPLPQPQSQPQSQSQSQSQSQPQPQMHANAHSAPPAHKTESAATNHIPAQSTTHAAPQQPAQHSAIQQQVARPPQPSTLAQPPQQPSQSQTQTPVSQQPARVPTSNA
ncbi:hypothetical protein DRE_05262 [Drechslerella stenobrocha 248]|uniref:Telomere repeat-binding factor dimerisation domain-containing protein n=1 Tax=Drechslerella stenobrocha 248 TaxID=1043628 RepID=W7HNP9_9PEZI|nr:hypothetical protein DRE_05262 [Drechslerella stenobrocha 248]